MEEQILPSDLPSDLPFEELAKRYEQLEQEARGEAIAPESRRAICARLDETLERLIDALPHSEAPDAPDFGIFTPAVQGFRHWSNVELMKDKGLCGYLLAREIGARAVMYFGTQAADYPYLNSLPGLEMLHHKNDETLETAYIEHLCAHSHEMDTLILHGMYPQTIAFLHIYRKFRPDGRVYCGLDMNGRWMNRVQWDSEFTVGFLKQCDVVATSCRKLRDELNANPSFRAACRWLPNGFYNPSGIPIIANFERKRNVILTVGRIGATQKNNVELMEAFARASDGLRDWSLRLVGPIEPGFQRFIDKYFSERPDLKERVIFTGPINNKEELFKEYARAKIFAMSSMWEGGAPNVYAEALVHGCMIVTSNIDAADEMTNGGELGSKYLLGDVNALAHTLVKLCAGADERAFQAHIPKARAYAAKYFDWKRNAKKLAYMLFMRGGGHGVQPLV